MIHRRSLLLGILSAGVAPAFVRAGVLMPVKQIIAPKPIVDPFGQYGYVNAKWIIQDFIMEFNRSTGRMHHWTSMDAYLKDTAQWVRSA